MLYYSNYLHKEPFCLVEWLQTKVLNIDVKENVDVSI